jgi:hypothetical protein
MGNPVEVLGIAPTPGTAIDPDDYVVLDVRSLTALVRVLIAVQFDGYSFTELAYAGVPTDLSTGWQAPYSGNCRLETITDGLYFRYRFYLLRIPVWPNSPQVTVYAFNEDGEEC